MDQLPVVQGGALGVIVAYSGWSLWALVTGRLIPRSWVDAMRAQDKVIEADLRSRLTDANETNTELRKQLTVVLDEHGKTVTQVMRSLPVPGEEDRS